MELVIKWLSVQLAITLTSGNLRRLIIFWILCWGKFNFLDYHESNLSLMAREIMQLLVNNQFILFSIRSKSTSLRKLLQIILSYFCYFTVISSSFDVQKKKTKQNKKRRPKTDLEKCFQCSVSIKISLDLKVCFFPSNANN